MNYDFIAIPDAEVPLALEPVFQHVVTTYASEANKTVSVWRAVPDDLLDFKPLIFAVAYFFIRWITARTTLQLLGVRLLWVVLTVLFEIGLGRLVLGLPWERITEDYDVTRGGVMGVGLLFMAAAPWLAAWLRGSPVPD
jgi:hypothetical protein